MDYRTANPESPYVPRAREAEPPEFYRPTERPSRLGETCPICGNPLGQCRPPGWTPRA